MQFGKVSGGYLVRLEKGEETIENLRPLRLVKNPSKFLPG